MKRISLLVLCLAVGSSQIASAEVISYQADFEVTKAFYGVAVGQKGSFFVSHDLNIADQNNNPNIGWFGEPVGPSSINILYDFGNGTAAATDGGFINITNISEDFYDISARHMDTVKGSITNQSASGSAGFFRDTTGTAHSNADLFGPPKIGDYNVQVNGSMGFQFAGSNASIGWTVTRVTSVSLANAAAVLTAGSPAALTQALLLGATPIDVDFQFQFDTDAVLGGGSLSVLLDGNVIGTFGASNAGVLQNGSVTASGVAGSKPDLTFRYDGPSGSTLLLDNILAPDSDLLNGNFQTHTLAAWTTSGAGSVGTSVFATTSGSVPEPNSLAIMGFLAFLALVFHIRLKSRAF